VTETPAKLRKEAERQRMKAQGFKRFEAWVHPDDFEKVATLVAKLRRKRTPDSAAGDK
jgi:L-alanine-DL-glutamate epimerase-like enolase superfamily enzyme